MAKNGVLIASFCGTGKSYLCKKYPQSYSEIECWNYRKGDFPNNYVKDIISHLGKAKYLFISTDPNVLKELNKLGIEILLVYPDSKLRNEYLDRFLERNSPYDFIGVLMKHWNEWLNELKEQDYCKHIMLKNEQYLKDILIPENEEEEDEDSAFDCSFCGGEDGKHSSHYCPNNNSPFTALVKDGYD